MPPTCLLSGKHSHQPSNLDGTWWYQVVQWYPMFKQTLLTTILLLYVRSENIWWFPISQSFWFSCCIPASQCCFACSTSNLAALRFFTWRQEPGGPLETRVFPISYGKSPFLMGKSTISMAMFNSYVTNYQRVPENYKINRKSDHQTVDFG